MAMDTRGTTKPSGPEAGDSLAVVQSRIRAAETAMVKARQTAAAAVDAVGRVTRLRQQLQVVDAAAVQAEQDALVLAGWRAGTLGLRMSGRLRRERWVQQQRVTAARTEVDRVVTALAEAEGRVADLHQQVREQQSLAAALPRLLDIAAGCIRAGGGPTGEALIAAEAGLDPVLHREAELAGVLRLAYRAQQRLTVAREQLLVAETTAGYHVVLATGPIGEEPAAGAGRPRLANARQALREAYLAVDALQRELVEVRTSALDEIPGDLAGLLDVRLDPGPVLPSGAGPVPVRPPVTGSMPALAGPRSPAPAGPTGGLDSVEAQTRQADQLFGVPDRIRAARAAVQHVADVVNAVRERLEVDHAGTVHVLRQRRSQWRQVLRGA